MTQFQTLAFAVTDRIARITLSRPDSGNAINPDLARELAEAALACSNDPAVKVVLIAARGKMFCSGGDLKAFTSFGDETSVRVKAMADDLHKALSLLARMSAPVVVAVNGAAAGAGFSLAIAGDIVLAGRSAKFTMAYTAAGLSPDGGATYHLPRLVGIRRAHELALTNRVLSAEQAAEWGLITRVVADDDLDEEALAVCRTIAAGPAAAHAVTKRLLLESLHNSLETQTELEGREIARAAGSADGIEGVRAFVEKRRPNFK